MTIHSVYVSGRETPGTRCDWNGISAIGGYNNEKMAGQADLHQGPLSREAELGKFLHELLQQFRSETGTIHVLDAKNQLLHLVAQIGLPPQLLDIVKTIPVGKGIAGQVVAQNKPVAICNLQTDSSGVAKPGAKQTAVGGALCVPVRDGGKTIGTLGVGTVRQYEFTADEQRKLEEIGRRLSAILKV
ncbi:MAG TPA: GAF domain-containing protein [Verrucomicrobiae bacterium]|nr:GAF domain-containing protein [Verrucomicrobiae bacterium]